MKKLRALVDLIDVLEVGYIVTGDGKVVMAMFDMTKDQFDEKPNPYEGFLILVKALYNGLNEDEKKRFLSDVQNHQEFTRYLNKIKKNKDEAL